MQDLQNRRPKLKADLVKSFCFENVLDKLLPAKVGIDAVALRDN